MDGGGGAPRQPPQAVKLPPGVYFNPGPEEIVCNYLNRHIAGEMLPETENLVFHADVYGKGPNELRLSYPACYKRDLDEKWFFFSECQLQSAGRGKSPRANRVVATGGYWRVEQRKAAVVVDGVAVGYKHCFGFYVPAKPDDIKTPWLMEEYTSRAPRAGGTTAPVLCKIYFSPRSKDKRREILGEDSVPVGLDGKVKPARLVVTASCFDAVAALLGHGVPAAGDLGHHDQGHFAEAPPPAPADHGQHVNVEAPLQDDHEHGVPMNGFLPELPSSAPGTVMGYDHEAMVVSHPMSEWLQMLPHVRAAHEPEPTTTTQKSAAAALPSPPDMPAAAAHGGGGSLPPELPFNACGDLSDMLPPSMQGFDGGDDSLQMFDFDVYDYLSFELPDGSTMCLGDLDMDMRVSDEFSREPSN